MLVGGLVAFGAYKMSSRDADRIEQHTGVPPEELEDQELERAMDDLGIERQTVSAEDREQGGDEPSAGGDAGAGDIDQLTRLAELHEQGILTDEEFAAKKTQILGLD
jgi:hypothetical protein